MTTNPEVIRDTVRERYAKQALRVIHEPAAEVCCGPACDSVGISLYSTAEAQSLPTEAVQASLGCGNPTALAALGLGDVVLDLGSGGGIDVLLAAQRVGPSGFVYGLDMTDEMLALAKNNQASQGATNVQFLKGFIEQIPLSDAAVDVIISNCVINLSADKSQVLRESFRVLRPGGRLAISDVVVLGSLPAEVRRDLESWVGCVAGALEENEYRELLGGAGFEAIAIETTSVFGSADAATSAGCWHSSGCGEADLAGDGELISAFVQARKPSNR